MKFKKALVEARKKQDEETLQDVREVKASVEDKVEKILSLFLNSSANQANMQYSNVEL